MDQVKDILRDVRLPALSKNLLGRLIVKELNLDQFLRECAYWAIKDGFDDLRPRHYPTKPTKALELENMPLQQRLHLDYYKLYMEFPQIRTYYEQTFFIRNHNSGVLSWLHEIKSYLPEDDTIIHNRINARILEFRAFEDDLTLQAEKIKDVFEATEIYSQ